MARFSQSSRMRTAFGKVENRRAAVNALQGFEQAIHDCEAAVVQGRRELVHFALLRRHAEQELAKLGWVLKHKENQGKKIHAALGADRALDGIAQCIVDAECKWETLTRQRRQLERCEAKLERVLHLAVVQITHNRRELRLYQLATRELHGMHDGFRYQMGELRRSSDRLAALRNGPEKALQTDPEGSTIAASGLLGRYLVAAGIRTPAQHHASVISRLQQAG